MNIGKRLKDKVAIVTGGASGIGAETVKTFAAHGAIVVAADVQDEQGECLVNEVKEAGGQAIYRRLDVVDEEAWRVLVDEIIQTYQKLDILGNIAGVAIAISIGTTRAQIEEWRKVIDINVKGVWYGIKYG